jgi:hypothetical protein
MPIISSNFNQIGNSGQQPGTCFIETDDSLTTIQTAGYLNTLERQGLPLSENLMALVGINKGAAKSTVWMAIHFSNGDWSLVPSAIEPSLNAKYLVQQPNATLPNAQAMSALATGIVKNTTTTGVQSIAVANVDYQPALSGESLTAVTVATDDKILIQDTSDSNNLKTVTAQSVAALAGAVTSVTGTANRITSSGGATPSIDISASYVGQGSITTVGTVSTGVWNGTVVDVPHGGTGVATLTTANGVLCANTTATGAVVTVAPSSDTTFVLTSNGTSAPPSFKAAAGGGVTSVTGTTNRVTSTGGSTPVIDISASYVGQSSITTLGTVTSGLIQPGAGGTGVANTGTITVGGNTAFSGAFTFTGTITGNTAVTFPTSGTLATTASASGTVNSGTANQVAYYASTTNAVSGLSTTARAAFTSNSTGVPTWVALTDGQVIVGSTAGSPAAATLTAGTGITITSASNSITVASASAIQSVTFTLTAANIKAMFATPVQVIAAPGAHKIIVVTEILCEFVRVAPSYTAGGSWGLQYGNSAQFASPGGYVLLSSIDLTSGSNDLAFVSANPNTGGVNDTADYINQGIFASNQTAAYLTGNGTVTFTLYYLIMNTTS